MEQCVFSAIPIFTFHLGIVEWTTLSADKYTQMDHANHAI